MSTECAGCSVELEDPEYGFHGRHYCEYCHNRTCSECRSEIPEEEKYDLGGMTAGITCPECTGHYVEWLCKGCGAEIKDEDEQIEIRHQNPYDGTYCEECAEEWDVKVIEVDDSRDEEAPF